MTILTTIALLCQISVSTGGSFKVDSADEVLTCQKYYVKCLKSKGATNLRTFAAEDALFECVAERKL